MSKRIYLLSNGPDVAYVNCFDADTPEQPPVILLPDGLELETEYELADPTWRSRLMASLPQDYRCEPDLWMITCSTERFFGPHRAEFERQLSLAGYKHVRLVAESDAVKAFYQKQHGGVLPCGDSRRVAVLTLGRNEYRYDIMQETHQNRRDDVQYGSGTPSSELDNILVHRLLREPLDWEDLHFRHLSQEMGRLRRQYLHKSLETGDWFETYSTLVSGGGEFRDITLSINDFLLEQACYYDDEYFTGLATSVPSLLQEHCKHFPLFHTDPGLPDADHRLGLILCNGLDWCMKPLADAMNEAMDYPVMMDGAHEAAIRGLELLAPTILRVHAVEQYWKALRTSDPSLVVSLDHLFHTYMVKPLYQAIDPHQYIHLTPDQAVSHCYHAYEEVRRQRKDVAQMAWSLLLEHLLEDILRAIPDPLRSLSSDRCLKDPFAFDSFEPYLSYNEIMKTCLVMESFTYDALKRYAQFSDQDISSCEFHKEVKDTLWNQYELHCRENLEITSRDQMILHAFGWIQDRLFIAIRQQFGFTPMEVRWYFHKEIGDVDKSILKVGDPL